MTNVVPGRVRNVAHSIFAGVFVVCSAGLLAACGGSSSDAQKAAHLRLPRAPDERQLTPGPAVLDTIQPFQMPAGITHQDWQLNSVVLDGGWRVRYLMPLSWKIGSHGKGTSGDGLVRVQVKMTPVHDDQLSLAAYAAALAEGRPISRLPDAGVPAYLTARLVSAAPSDPIIQSSWFHTVVLDLDGNVAKVECRYDASNKFRFFDVCQGVLGSVTAEHTPG